MIVTDEERHRAKVMCLECWRVVADLYWFGYGDVPEEPWAVICLHSCVAYNEV